MNRSTLKTRSLNQMVKYFVARGLVEDTTIINQYTRQDDKQNRFDNYHNTEELLKVYSVTVKRIDEAVEELARKSAEPIYGHLDSARCEKYVQEEKENLMQLLDKPERWEFECMSYSIISRMYALRKTKLLLDYTNAALLALKNSKQGEALYKALEYTYLRESDDSEMTPEDIATALGCCRSTYYNRRDEATKRLSALLWDTPNPEIDAFLEAVYIFSETQ